MKSPKATDTICPRPKCGGILCNTSARMHDHLGMLRLECDRCHWALGCACGNCAVQTYRKVRTLCLSGLERNEPHEAYLSH